MPELWPGPSGPARSTPNLVEFLRAGLVSPRWQAVKKEALPPHRNIAPRTRAPGVDGSAGGGGDGEALRGRRRGCLRPLRAPPLMSSRPLSVAGAPFSPSLSAFPPVTPKPAHHHLIRRSSAPSHAIAPVYSNRVRGFSF